MKLSFGKRTCPAAKQVWRVFDSTDSGRAVHDVVGLAGEAGPADGVPLLTCVVRGGKRVQLGRPIDEIRILCQAAVARLPDGVRRHRDASVYPVVLGDNLERLAAGVAAELSARGTG